MWDRSLSSEEDDSRPKSSTESTILRWLALCLEIVGGVLVTIIAVYLRYANLHPGATELNWKMLCGDMSLFAKRTNVENSFLLYSIVVLIPIGYIAVGELEQLCIQKKANFMETKGKQRGLNWSRILRIFAMFVLGFMLASFTADYLKILITQPRPYFLTVYGGNCQSPYNGNIEESEEFFEALKSFPSHLATMAGFCSLYAVAYSHKVHRNRASILLPIASQAFLVLAVTVSLRRYTSHQNHLLDIVAGLAIGSAIGLYTSCLVINQVKPRSVLVGESELTNVFIPRVSLPATLAAQALNVQNEIPRV